MLTKLAKVLKAGCIIAPLLVASPLVSGCAVEEEPDAADDSAAVRKKEPPKAHALSELEKSLAATYKGELPGFPTPVTIALQKDGLYKVTEARGGGAIGASPAPTLVESGAWRFEAVKVVAKDGKLVEAADGPLSRNKLVLTSDRAKATPREYFVSIKRSELGTAFYFVAVAEAEPGLLGVTMALVPDAPPSPGEPGSVRGPSF
jgi:hypothetical protein